jgi:hypothetical protein
VVVEETLLTVQEALALEELVVVVQEARVQPLQLLALQTQVVVAEVQDLTLVLMVMVVQEDQV